MTAKDFGQLLREHPEMLDDEQTFENILKDSYPNEKANVRLMITAFQAGIVPMIQEMTNQITHFLMDECFIMEEKARWAAELWMNACYSSQHGELEETTPIDTTPAAAKPAAQKKTTPKPAPATDAKYFEVVETESGCCITKYTGSDTQVVIPAQLSGIPVTEIGGIAFKDCSGLTSITIPDSVTHITDGTLLLDGAFWGCSGLTSITIPDSITHIGNCAFKDCSGLTSITIPDSVTYIGGWAFAGCSGLPSITIPDSVTYIGDYAFISCRKLVINGSIGSAAHQYAKKEKISFRAI